MASPVDYGAAAAAAAAAASSYSDHMMRPLMVDVRRADGTNTSGGDDQSQHSQHQQHSHLQHSHHSHHLSPTGLSPGFGNIGFGSGATSGMGSSDILSPLSPTSNTDHRYGNYSSLSSGVAGATTTSASGSGMSPRTSIPYTRQSTGSSGLDGSQNQSQQGQSQQSSHQRHHIRPLQPLQLRETVSRSRSDNLQSPLRSSMSWKGETLDYSNYHHGSATGGAGSTSPGRSSLYPSDGLGNGSSSAGLGGYDSYSGKSILHFLFEFLVFFSSCNTLSEDTPSTDNVGRLYRPFTDAHGLSGLPNVSGYASSQQQSEPHLAPPRRFSYTALGP